MCNNKIRELHHPGFFFLLVLFLCYWLIILHFCFVLFYLFIFVLLFFFSILLFFVFVVLFLFIYLFAFCFLFAYFVVVLFSDVDTIHVYFLHYCILTIFNQVRQSLLIFLLSCCKIFEYLYLLCSLLAMCTDVYFTIVTLLSDNILWLWDPYIYPAKHTRLHHPSSPLNWTRMMPKQNKTKLARASHLQPFLTSSTVHWFVEVAVGGRPPSRRAPTSLWGPD